MQKHVLGQYEVAHSRVYKSLVLTSWVLEASFPVKLDEAFIMTESSRGLRHRKSYRVLQGGGHCKYP